MDLFDTEKNNFDFQFAHLNDMQRKAVMTTDGALLLLAGAGSGKTTVLMNRIAHLLVNKGAEPYEIIAITFTNKAAGEMKERLRQMNIPGAGEVWASTFHSACARILRRDIDKLGYDRSFTIYDTADCAAVMRRILREMEVDEKTISHKTVLSYISRAKDDMVSASEFEKNAEKYADPRRRIIGRAYSEYEKRLRSSNSLDFDDLILLTVKLLQNQPDVLQYYQNRFRYVLVDEYQDTNSLQYRLVAAFAGKHGNICVVGDDDQSIYKFRGATIDNILNFEKQFKNAQVIRLEQNYRSTDAILSAANDVIKNNKSRKGKKLWTENGAGDKPVLYIVSDEREEAQLAADEITESVREGRKWQDHVILYRMNAQSNQFETAFKRCGIPYRVYGGTGFYERAEIKDMLAYLCVIHNPDDDARLLRIINNPARGLGDTTLSRLLAIADELGISAFRAIYEAYKYENMLSAMPKLKKFADMIEELREIERAHPLDALYDELVKKTGYVRMLEAKDTVENQSRIENVRELKTNIIAFMNENSPAPQGGRGLLFDFLSETALYTDLDRDDQNADKVLMMTMHSAKGLEFDTVFIAGAEEGIFPGARTIGDPDEIEEERRLCYVAMTRAIRRLCFTSARRRMLFGKTASSQPSRFVGEIDRTHIEVKDESDFGIWTVPEPAYQYKRNYNDYKQPGKQEGTISYNDPYNRRETATADYHTGDTVEHTAFGRGVIQSITPAGSDALLVIDFENGETKRMLRKAAGKYMAKVTSRSPE